jgi:hypothetical protein
VIKSLEVFRPKGVAGVTTLANGQIVLILDMKELLEAARRPPQRVARRAVRAGVGGFRARTMGQGGRWRCRSGGSRERLLHRVCTAAERLCRRGASRAFSGLAVLRPAGVPTALRR